jgi:predicted component of type VI protein secretion system
MIHLLSQLKIVHGRLNTTDNLKRSIDSFLALLISSPRYRCVVDRDFGFVFNNLRFEIFNENEGVVYDSTTENDTKILPTTDTSLYELKISGSSKNLNTFASELKDAITKYEKRLTDVAVSMTYIREERRIYVSVKGVIPSTMERYQYTTTINIWN